MTVAGRPLVAWSVAAFAAVPRVRNAVLTSPPGREDELRDAVADAAGGDLAITVVPGGATRAQSVAAGLEAVADALVAVHDAARPLVTPRLIESLLAVLDRDPGVAGVIAATPVADTLKRGRGDHAPAIEETIDREGLWAAQTPQVFRTEILRRAHAAEDAATATDDAMLVERAGETVLLQPSGEPNLKVTTPADLRMVEAFLSASPSVP